MSSRKLRSFIAVSILLIIFGLLGEPPALRAQAVSIASVTGRVTDQEGAVLSGAQITITGVDTGTVHSIVTNAAGLYTVPSLPIGAYTLQVTAPGFQTYEQTGILLRVNDNVQINVTMKVGQLVEKVEVQADAGMVQTQQNTISQVIDQRRIVDLPLNGRDPTQLITISGASINHSDGTNTGSKSFFSSQSISIAGSAGNETNYLLDGGDNNDSFTNVNMPFPFPDALAEFSVETSTLPARNGLHPGGVVNAVTKSGTNQWHGDLFEFIRNGNVNAINYFAPRQDSLKRNQFGGTLGGKIIRDRLFFLAVFSSPIFARTRPQLPLMFRRQRRWQATSAYSTAPVAKPKELPAPLTIRPPACRCQTSNLVQAGSIPRRSRSPNTCRQRRTLAAEFLTGSRLNLMKASMWDVWTGSSARSRLCMDAIFWMTIIWRHSSIRKTS